MFDNSGFSSEDGDSGVASVKKSDGESGKKVNKFSLTFELGLVFEFSGFD
jgi:hypothetical protein